MTDRLDEIKARWANKPEALEVSKAWALVDIRWLIGEVEEWRQAAAAEADLANERGRTIERLRGLLGRLEWAGRSDFSEQAACPVCELLRDPEGRHEPGCWLAAELAPNANDPPGGEQP
jgi:hypothetical protein